MAIDFQNTQAVEQGGPRAKDVPGGGYVCKVMSAERGTTKGGKPGVHLTWDVAEGDFAGAFSADFFASKPWRHDAWLLEGDPNTDEGKKTNGITKGKLEKMIRSNSTPTGYFDAFYAFNEAPQLMVGRLVGLVLQERKRTYNGREYSEVQVFEWKTVEDIKAGRFEVPPVKDERTPASQAAPAPTTYDADIPF